MPISQQDYWLKPNESTEQYTQRIAQLRAADTQKPPTTTVNVPIGTDISGNTMWGAKPTVEPTKTGQIQPTTTAQTPILPTPQAPTIQEQYTQSALTNLEAQRKQLEDTYTKQLAASQEQAKQSQAKLDEITKKYEGTLEEAKPYTEPFRQQFETTERNRLQVEQNYFANQTLTNELEGLLTDIQDTLQREKDVTGLASIREPRIAKATEDMTARVGVIEAVMATRNNQITVANNLIDRSVTAINADRKDKLSYYDTLLSYYSTQKDGEGKKLITLTSDQKKLIDSQIDLLKSDMANSQKNADAIKTAMTDPDTAMAYAQAGITLNDTPEQINKKLADWGYTQEIATTSKDMAEKGYSYLSPGQTAPTGTKTMSVTDSKGVTKQWYVKEAISLAEKPATAAQQTVAGYTARIEQSNPLLEEQESYISKMSYLNFKTLSLLPSAFQGANFRQYDQAARNFINATLRRESGAAISANEFDNARRQYLPMPGDDPGTLANKKANRDIVYASFKQSSGSAYSSVEELLGNITIPGGETEIYESPDGTNYVKGEDGLYYPQ